MPDLAIVMLSQHVETRHSVDLVSQGRFGYLLKDRVFDVDDFLDALRRVPPAAQRSTPRSSRRCSARAANDPLSSSPPASETCSG